MAKRRVKREPVSVQQIRDRFQGIRRSVSIAVAYLDEDVRWAMEELETDPDSYEQARKALLEVLNNLMASTNELQLLREELEATKPKTE